MILFIRWKPRPIEKGGLLLQRRWFTPWVKPKPRFACWSSAIGRLNGSGRDVACHDDQRVKDDHFGPLAYSGAAADVFCHPAWQIIFPTGAGESGLRHAGRGVRRGRAGSRGPMETGYLARHKDAQDFGRHQRLLDDDDLRRRLGIRCRAVAEAEYDMELQTQRFEKLCTSG